MPPFRDGEGREISCEYIMTGVFNEYIIRMTAKPMILFFIFTLICGEVNKNVRKIHFSGGQLSGQC